MRILPLFFATATVTVLCSAMALANEAHGATNVLAHGPLLKEPKYESSPKYSLIVLGGSGDVKVWMVEDGKRLFVDKNANGNLTDDGPPIQPSDVRNHGGNDWDFDYYTTVFKVPDGAVAGKAKITVDLPTDTTAIVLTTTEFEVPVVAKSKE